MENCPFSGTAAELQSAQIRAAGVEKLLCPACGAGRPATIRGELVIYPPHTPLRMTRANKGPLWIRQGTAWIKRERGVPCTLLARLERKNEPVPIPH